MWVSGDSKPKRVCRGLLVLFLTLGASLAQAETSDTSLLVLVDTSPAMSSRLGSQTRFDVVSRALKRFLRTRRHDRQIEVLTYGYSSNQACEGIVFDSPISSSDSGLLDAQFRCVEPRSKLPLDLVLAPQVSRFMEASSSARVVIVSGGFETFQNDPCYSADSIDEATKRSIQVSIVEFGRDEGLDSSSGLACLADSYGGIFRRVEDEDSLYREMMNVTESDARVNVSFTASLDGTTPVEDMNLVWRVTPIPDEDGAEPLNGYSPIEITGNRFDEVLYAGRYSVGIEGDSVGGMHEVRISPSGSSVFVIPVECFPGHHTNSERAPTACFSDLEFQSCGPSRQDCRDIQPGRGFVTCNGDRCDVTCEDGYHTNAVENPSLCIENTNLKSCGIHRLDCTGKTILGGEVGCDGITCTLTCGAGSYASETTADRWTCEENTLVCNERSERHKRAMWASLGGGATFLGSLGLFVAQRLQARELRDDVNAFNAGEVRPRVEQVDLLERGAAIGALEGSAMTLIGAGAIALGYAGWEYLISPSARTFACEELIPINLIDPASLTLSGATSEPGNPSSVVVEETREP